MGSSDAASSSSVRSEAEGERGAASAGGGLARRHGAERPSRGGGAEGGEVPAGGGSVGRGSLPARYLFVDDPPLLVGLDDEEIAFPEAVLFP